MLKKTAPQLSQIHLVSIKDDTKFEIKLKQLLDFLEQDKEGIANLANNANGHIQVTINFHNSNTMLGGPMIDKNNIKRISALNLEIDFDLYAKGNFFK